MNTTDNTVQTWRDLLDELTDQQIAQLRHGQDSGWLDAELLDAAQDFTASNRTQEQYAHIPAPADSTRLGKWWDNGDAVTRYFDGTTRNVANSTVLICGEQKSDGTSRRWVEVRSREFTDSEVSAEQAREMAAALTAAADELNRLDGTSPPFM